MSALTSASSYAAALRSVLCAAHIKISDLMCMHWRHGPLAAAADTILQAPTILRRRSY